MDDADAAAAEFEQHRPRLRAISYRILGSTAEADDAVQETWLRFDRQDRREIDNLGAWLTTVVARVALNLLRTRRTRREEPLELRIPDPVVGPVDGKDPEQEAMLADAVGLALGVVLGTLGPAERLAFVLHDMFGVAFDDIATILQRTPQATRQLASRARARIRAADTEPEPDLDVQRVVVQAYLDAARNGDFAGLLNVLDPDIVLRRDFGGDGPVEVIRGARTVAAQATVFARDDLTIGLAMVNGTVGLASARAGAPFSVGGVLVRDGHIVALDFLLDPERLAGLDLRFLTGG